MQKTPQKWHRHKNVHKHSLFSLNVSQYFQCKQSFCIFSIYIWSNQNSLTKAVPTQTCILCISQKICLVLKGHYYFNIYIINEVIINKWISE